MRNFILFIAVAAVLLVLFFLHHWELSYALTQLRNCLEARYSIYERYIKHQANKNWKEQVVLNDSSLKTTWLTLILDKE